MSDESEDVKAISTLMSILKPLDQDTRIHVLEFVVKRLGISLTAETSARPHVTDSPTSPAASPSAPAISGATDIRTFSAEKSPKTVNEKVAVIAYYLAHLAPAHERRDYVISDDIRTYFIRADFHLPAAAPAMTLAHAKNAGYLNALDRGRYKLNAVGHNLVAHKLPDTDGGKNKRKRPKGPAKNKARSKAKK